MTYSIRRWAVLLVVGLTTHTAFADTSFPPIEPASSNPSSSVPESSAPSTMPSSVPPTAVPALFPDVPSTHPNHDAICWAKDEGVVRGYDDGLFRPERAVSRVEALKMLYLGILETVPTSTARSGFTDLDETSWYLPYVRQAKADGIVSGNGDGTFAPDRTVSNVELLKMALRMGRADLAANTATSPYIDVPTTMWYAPYVAYAAGHGLIDIAPTLGPDAGMSRATVAELLYRFDAKRATIPLLAPGVLFSVPGEVIVTEPTTAVLGLSGEGKASYYADSLAGNGTASGEKYDPLAKTCAHRTFRFGTVMRMTNALTGATTTCRVNDRGPFIVGRVLDLSRSTFEDLAPLSRGVIAVRWEVVELAPGQ